MPRPLKMPPLPTKVRIDEKAFDMIFAKADVPGPARAVDIDKLIGKIRKIRRESRT